MGQVVRLGAEDAARFRLDAAMLLPVGPGRWLLVGRSLREPGLRVHPELIRQVGPRFLPGGGKAHNYLGGPIHTLSLHEEPFSGLARKLAEAGADEMADALAAGLGRCLDILPRETARAARAIGWMNLPFIAMLDGLVGAGRSDHLRILMDWPILAAKFFDAPALLDAAVDGASVPSVVSCERHSAAAWKRIRKVPAPSVRFGAMQAMIVPGAVVSAVSQLPPGTQAPATPDETAAFIALNYMAEEIAMPVEGAANRRFLQKRMMEATGRDWVAEMDRMGRIARQIDEYLILDGPVMGRFLVRMYERLVEPLLMAGERPASPWPMMLELVGPRPSRLAAAADVWFAKHWKTWTENRDLPTSWPALLKDEVVDPASGYRILPLDDVAALASEGSAMSHCVLGSRQACAEGRRRIFSIRDKSGGRISTLRIDWCDGRFENMEHRGFANANPHPVAESAAKYLLLGLNCGVIAYDPSAMRDLRMERRADPDVFAAVFAEYAPCLPKAAVVDGVDGLLSRLRVIAATVARDA